MDDWLRIVRSRLAQQTFESYEGLLNKHVRPRMGELTLSEIKQSNVQGLYDAMQVCGLSARTIRYVHAVLRMAFQKAIEHDKILRNPCEFVVLPKQARSETKAMSPDEARQFVLASREAKHGLIVEFALVTGMRPEEYLALRWSDIDLDDGIVRVQKALVWNRKGGSYRMEEPKTKQSKRSIPIPETLCMALRSHRRHQLEQRMALGSAYINLDLVFASELGSPLNSRNLAQRQFATILSVAGLKDRGFVLYSLRHTCATLLLAAGENPKVVSERLGHTSVKMTLDTYTHVLPDMQRSASDRLGKLLYG